MCEEIASQAPLFLQQTTTVDFASITREPVIVRPREERLDPGSNITLVIPASNPASVISNLAIEVDVIFVVPYLGPTLLAQGFYDKSYTQFNPTLAVAPAPYYGYANSLAYACTDVFLNWGANGILNANVTIGAGPAVPNPFADPSYPYNNLQSGTEQFQGKFAPLLTSTPLPPITGWAAQGAPNSPHILFYADRPFPNLEPHKGEGWIGALFSRIVIQAANGQIFQELNGAFGYSPYHKLKMYLQNDRDLLEQYDYYAGTNIFSHQISPFPDLFAHLPHGHRLANSVIFAGLNDTFNSSILGRSTMTVTKHVICTLPFPLDHFPPYFISAGDNLQLIISIAPNIGNNFTSNPQFFSGSLSLQDDSFAALNALAFDPGMVYVEHNPPIQDVLYSPTLTMFDYRSAADLVQSPFYVPALNNIPDGIGSGLSVQLKAFYLDTDDITALLGAPDLSITKGRPVGLDADNNLVWDAHQPLSQIRARGFTAYMKISYLDNPSFTGDNRVSQTDTFAHAKAYKQDITATVGRPRAEHRDVAVKIFANQIKAIFVEPITSLSASFPANLPSYYRAAEKLQNDSISHKAGRVRIELVSPVFVHLPIQDAMYGATLQSIFTSNVAAMNAANDTIPPTGQVLNTPQPSYSFNSYNNTKQNFGVEQDTEAFSSNQSFANLNFTLQYTIAVGAKCMPEWPHFGYTPVVSCLALQDEIQGGFVDHQLNWHAMGPEVHRSYHNGFLPPTPDVLPVTSYSLKNLVLRYDYSLMPKSLTDAFLQLYTRSGIKLSYVQPFVLETTLQSLVNRTTQFLLPVTTPCGFSVSVHQTDLQNRGGPVYLPISPFSSITITLGGQQVVNNIPSSHLLLAAGSPYPLFTPNCSSTGVWKPNPHIITRNSGIDFFLLAPLQMTWSNIAGKADYPVNLAVAVAFQDHFSTYWAFNSSGGCSVHKITTPILLNYSISSYFHPSVVYPIFNLKNRWACTGGEQIYPAISAANVALCDQVAPFATPPYTWTTTASSGYPYFANAFEGMFMNSALINAAEVYVVDFSSYVPIDNASITSFHSWPEVPYPTLFNSPSITDGTGLKLRVTIYQALTVTCRASNLFGGSASLPSLVFTS